MGTLEGAVTRVCSGPDCSATVAAQLVFRCSQLNDKLTCAVVWCNALSFAAAVSF